MGNNNILKKVAQFDERLFLTLFNCNSPKWLKKMAFGLSKSGDGGLYLVICAGVWWLSKNELHQLLPIAIMPVQLYILALATVAILSPD